MRLSGVINEIINMQTIYFQGVPGMFIERPFYYIGNSKQDEEIRTCICMVTIPYTQSIPPELLEE